MWSVRVSQANPGGRLPRFRDDRLLPPRAQTKTTENSSVNKIAKYSGDNCSLPSGPFFFWSRGCKCYAVERIVSFN
jgi:hypothetical protein